MYNNQPGRVGFNAVLFLASLYLPINYKIIGSLARKHPVQWFYYVGMYGIRITDITEESNHW